MRAATILRVCEWPGCHRAARSAHSKYCPRHRPWCRVAGCPKRALPARTTCGAHMTGRSGPKRIRGRQAGVPHEPLPTECTVDGCDRRPKARGLCWKHYRRQLRTGSTADPFPPDVTCRYCAERRAPGTDGLCLEHRRRLRANPIDPLLPKTLRAADRPCVNGDGRPGWRKGLCSPCYWQRRSALFPRPKRATVTAPAGQPASDPNGPSGPEEFERLTTFTAEDWAKAAWERRARAILDKPVDRVDG